MPLLTMAHNLSDLTALQSALQVVQRSPGFHVALWADAGCPTASYSTKKLLCLAHLGWSFHSSQHSAHCSKAGCHWLCTSTLYHVTCGMRYIEGKQ